MKAFQDSHGTIYQINIKLLFALTCALIAFYSWPSHPKYWGFGFISICMGLAAIGVAFDALRTMAKLYQRDKTLSKYMAQGNKPKSSKMASLDAMKKAGMIK
ncbi:MAG: hypothetical protein COA52_20230 [Hyphomicrobiales bacterium]|nr:MAG: hypothetical protein COA52_20230 [Hyphomicrobiales bacterium]